MILVCGDLMLDILMQGPMKGVAPGEPMSQWIEGDITTRLGGAGFAAKTMSTLLPDTEIRLGCVIGDDFIANEIQRLCPFGGGVEPRLHLDNYLETHTSVKAYTVANAETHGHQTLRFDRNRTISGYPSGYLQDISRGADAIVIIDMGEGFVSCDGFDLGGTDCPVFIDPRPESLGRYPKGKNVIYVCNEKSINDCTEKLHHAGHKYSMAVNVKALEGYSGGRVIVTLSSRGVMFVDGVTGKPKRESSITNEDVNQEPRSTVGAGNVFMAAMVKNVLDGLTIETSAKYAECTARHFVYYGKQALIPEIL